MEFQEGKVIIRHISKIEPGTGEVLILDLLIVTPEIKMAWDSRLKVEWEHGLLNVVSPEGLILLKSFRRSVLDQDVLSMKIDMSPSSITLRLRQVAQLRHTCLALAKSSTSLEIRRKHTANQLVRRTSMALGR